MARKMLIYKSCFAVSLSLSLLYLFAPHVAADSLVTSHDSSGSSSGNNPRSPLTLQVSAESPDSLGMGYVSGFYGSGTWSAWFLTIIGSWFRTLYGETPDTKKFDSNTWAFLLGMNWAAADLMKHLSTLRAARDAGFPDWTKECASIAAGYTVVFWGVTHVMAQLSTFHCRREEDFNRQRFLIFLIGLLLPGVALTTTSIKLNEHDIMDHIPSFYWRFIDASAHSSLLFVTHIIGPWCLVIAMACLLWHVRHFVPTTVRTLMGSNPYSTILFLSYSATLILLVSVKHSPIWWTCLLLAPMLVPLAIIACTLVPIVSACAVLVGSIVYIFAAYFHLVSSPSQSCFFMPCAPQSILELDQSFSLFAGIFALLAGDLGNPIFARITTFFQQFRTQLQQQTAQSAALQLERYRGVSEFPDLGDTRQPDVVNRRLQRRLREAN